MTVLTSREFNQDAGRAKKAAGAGPVFITDRGRTAHVLLTIEDYRRLVGGPAGAGIVDQLAYGGAADDDFDPAPISGPYRPADLS